MAEARPFSRVPDETLFGVCQVAAGSPLVTISRASVIYLNICVELTVCQALSNMQITLFLQTARGG